MFRNILCGVSCAAGILTSLTVYVINRVVEVVEAGDRALADVGNPPPKEPAVSYPPVDRLTAHYRSAKRRAGTLPAPIYPTLHWDDRGGDDDDVMEIVFHPTAPNPAPHSSNPAARWEDDVVDAVFKTIAARES